MQTRTQSLFEAIINVVVGLGISMALNFAIFPIFGWHINLSQNITLGVIYTIVSIIRSFCLRRYFNRKHSMPKEAASDKSDIGYGIGV